MDIDSIALYDAIYISELPKESYDKVVAQLRVINRKTQQIRNGKNR